MHRVQTLKKFLCLTVEKVLFLCYNKIHQCMEGSIFMTTISVLNRKGGAGKTTASINLAAVMAKEKDKKVLLIDLDPQANATTYLGFYKNNKPSINDVLCKGTDIRQAVKSTDISGLSVIPSDIDFDNADLQLAFMPAGKEFILKKILETVQADYDIVFLDCPPARNNITVNALAASDYAVLPCEASEFGIDSLQAMGDFISTVSGFVNSELKIAGVLFPKKEKTAVQELYENAIRNSVPYNVFKTTIRKTTIVDRSLNAHEPLVVYEPKAAVTDDYRNAANEILMVMEADNV